MTKKQSSEQVAYEVYRKRLQQLRKGRIPLAIWEELPDDMRRAFKSGVRAGIKHHCEERKW